MDESAADLAIQAWIDRCQAFAEQRARPLYLEYVPELEDPPFVPRDVGMFCREMEHRLGCAPCDPALRFAALYPLWSEHKFRFLGGEQVGLKAFGYLAGLCAPEQLTRLVDLKHELNYMYWAADWEKAKELFQRIALLELLKPQELFALRGHFLFVSVFGTQIRRELEGLVDGWIYDWPPSRPLAPVSVPATHAKIKYELDEPAGNLIGAVGNDNDDCFLRPDLLARGSYAHLILLAWCTNPRPPKPLWQDPPKLLEDAPCERDADRQLPLDPFGQWVRQSGRYEHELYRSFEPTKPPNLTEDQKLRLSGAVEDLKHVVDIGGALTSPYCPLLARALFAMGRFKEAARVFERMIDDLGPERANQQEHFLRKIKEGVEPWDALRGTSPDYGWETYFSAAWSHRLAGDSESAIATMQRLAASEPGARGTGYWIGRWYAEDGDYEQAAPYLKKELDDRFSPREFWQLRAILELAERAGEREEAATFLEDLEKKNPALLHAVTGLIAEHWPGFKALDRGSQSRLLYAEMQVHWDPPVRELYPAYLNSAVREFGWVLEHELKARVFEEFRKQVAADPVLRSAMTADYKEEMQDPFFRFLRKKPEITLGQMRFALEDCGQSELKTHQNFSLWLRQRFSSLQEAGTIEILKSVEEQRDRATHENVTFSVPEVLKVAAETRTVLSRVLLLRRTR